MFRNSVIERVFEGQFGLFGTSGSDVPALGFVGPCLGGVFWPYSWFSIVDVELLFEALYVEMEFFMLLKVLVWGPTLPEIRALILLSVCFFG